MSVFALLIPISLVLSTLFVWACIASIRGGQFDDLESPRWRILFQGAQEVPPPGAIKGSEPPLAKAGHDQD
jgi:cbb3-type cytochrome oxidase maturation protein